MVKLAEVRKAVGAAIAGAAAVEASGAVTGVADHWLKVAIGAVIAALASAGIVYTVPNSASKTDGL